jgi:transposase-like protein
MTTNAVDARIEHPMKYPLVRCPECGSARLDPVVERSVQEVHFLCRDCDRCWNVELGFDQRVAPSTCLGCAERARCQRAYAADHGADG